MFFSNTFISALALVSAALASPVEIAERQTQKLRIMPLGDSITEITCWRALVWDQLASAGLASQVQYVGSQNSNPQGCRPATSNWDQHHEGHSGWLAVDIANSYLEGWLKKTPADIVMFMLGTNDVTRGKTTQQIMDAYTKMVGIMRASNPKMKIIGWRLMRNEIKVDLVIPLSYSNNQVQAINAQIPSWAARLNSTESPIVIADCYNGFKTSDLRDGVHPNANGDKIIASKVGPLLLDFVRQSLGQ
ncbi:SGNH hydrolase [Sordaria brevicollis]|uniref:SGNH hydrolase n=1 Tax=Sordaria brevicollis TaxID=83679 RepID=A0AAE0UE48_SORBR|nr:SGNH hydrolase [Sordaria brevicollis]